MHWTAPCRRPALQYIGHARGWCCAGLHRAPGPARQCVRVSDGLSVIWTYASVNVERLEAQLNLNITVKFRTSKRLLNTQNSLKELDILLINSRFELLTSPPVGDSP